jgi:hypothetical protein
MVRFSDDEWTIARWRRAPIRLDEDFDRIDADGRVPFWKDVVMASAVVALLWTTALVFLR